MQLDPHPTQLLSLREIGRLVNGIDSAVDGYFEFERFLKLE
jgi:hypothetical protein